MAEEVNAPIIEDDADFSCFPVRKPKRPRSMRWKAFVVTWFIKMMARMYKFCVRLDVEVYGKENVPREGGAVGIGNHLSFLDPAFLGAIIPRNGAIMAAAELKRFLVMKFLFWIRGDVTVERGSDDGREKAFQKMRSIASWGGLCFMYAEGGIKRMFTDDNGNKRIRWNTGPVRIAREFQLPIFICKVEGTDNFWASTRADREARGGKRFNFRAPLKAAFLEPVPYDVYKDMTDVEAAEYCQKLCDEYEFPVAA